MRNKSLPKISCLMVTANGRWEHFVRSCQCYFDQIYPNRELVVVNEGPEDYQEKISQYLSVRNDVRLVFLKGKYTLGALRNIAINLSFGDVFVQWDDDDFNAPQRLMVQYKHLCHSKAKACFLSDQLHYYFPTKTLYWESWSRFHSGGHLKYSLIPGTIMAFRNGFNWHYPARGPWCKAGEDSVLAFRICEREEDVTLLEGSGHMQLYSYHGNNVWDIQHHEKISRERAMHNTFVLKHRDRICQTLDYMKFDGPIRVMGREGLAFIHA